MSALPRRLQVRTVHAAQLPAQLPALLRRIYAARRVTREQELATGLDALLPVGTLDNVREAAALLLAHAKGRVLIVGDFDADGATSTALMMHALHGVALRDMWTSWCPTAFASATV